MKCDERDNVSVSVRLDYMISFNDIIEIIFSVDPEDIKKGDEIFELLCNLNRNWKYKSEFVDVLERNKYGIMKEFEEMLRINKITINGNNNGIIDTTDFEFLIVDKILKVLCQYLRKNREVKNELNWIIQKNNLLNLIMSNNDDKTISKLFDDLLVSTHNAREQLEKHGAM